MTTILRRAPRRRRGPARFRWLAVALGGGALALLLALAWQRGGPRPVREVALALPDPVPAAGAQP
ncbi:MAG: hypothetical protein KGM17_11025 [Sphingomonadales bacterium]|nr:hypothetical protein [Sphingomonadales bacterium]